MEEKPSKSGRVLQVSLEGLDLSDAQFTRLENTMKASVLTELAKLDIAGGITMQPIGRGKIFDGHIINGIIIRDLVRHLKEQGIQR